MEIERKTVKPTRSALLEISKYFKLNNFDWSSNENILNLVRIEYNNYPTILMDLVNNTSCNKPKYFMLNGIQYIVLPIGNEVILIRVNDSKSIRIYMNGDSILYNSYVIGLLLRSWGLNKRYLIK